MKKLLALMAALTVTASAAPVTLTYWQYDFASKVSTMNDLIKKFEAQNPDIKIKQETFPYDAYNQKVASSVPAGQGPDVVNLFYGWLPQYVGGGFLQPLPEKDFPTARIESTFVPMIKTSKIGGKYYALPTSVRTLALFYNKDMMKASKVLTVPRTWEDFITAAQKMTKGTAPRYSQIGFGISPDGQDWQMLREVLIRQYGGTPYADGGKKVNYTTEAGVSAMKFYTELLTKHKIGTQNYFPGNNGYRDAFIAGKAGMIIDGSFAIASIKSGAKFNWGVVPLPTFKNSSVRGNFGSYWVNGITKNAKGDKLAAAVKFIKFLTTEETMNTWLRAVGEIPASKKLVGDPALRTDPVYGAFVQALPFASSTLFVDEAGQRQAWLDGINSVLKQGMSPADAMKKIAADEQKILNSYYK